MTEQEFETVFAKYAYTLVMGYNRYEKNAEQPPVSINWYWRSGGQSGGSCWDEGESTYYSIEGDEPPTETSLDKFLSDFCPEITFLQYKKIQARITYDTYHENEYYGNYSTYATAEITKESLKEVLKEIRCF